MNANDVKNLLSDQDIINLMVSLGSEYPTKTRDALLFSTICHAGDSKKLYYYTESKSFNCYSHCGFIGSIFDVVGKILDLEFSLAFQYVCKFFNINLKDYREVSDLRTDTSFIRKFAKKKEEQITLKVHDEAVLRHFDELYHHSWIEDYISKETMRVFDIRFDILNNRIIIPHRDIEGNLIGIRCRNLNENEVAAGRKYIPIYIDRTLYNYPTHANLYGIHLTKEAIKRYKTVIIVESEKAVQQLYSYFGEDCIAVACSGSVIHSYQIRMLQELGVETVVIAVDKDFRNIGDKEELLYRNKVKKSIVEKLNPYFNLQLIWDFNNYIGYKDSPTDKGIDVWNKLYAERLLL